MSKISFASYCVEKMKPMSLCLRTNLSKAQSRKYDKLWHVYKHFLRHAELCRSYRGGLTQSSLCRTLRSLCYNLNYSISILRALPPPQEPQPPPPSLSRRLKRLTFAHLESVGPFVLVGVPFFIVTATGK